jgi:hypothetical protein
VADQTIDPTCKEREGYDAWGRRETLDDCPYHFTPSDTAQWKRGWRAADQVFREALKSVTSP